MKNVKLVSVLGLAVVLVAAFTLPSCVPEVEEEVPTGPIKIALLIPLTGPFAMFGELQKNAFAIAYEDLEAEGKNIINGRKIELLITDTQSSKDIAKTAAERAISVDMVDMIGSVYSSAEGAAIAPVAEEYKVPVLINAASKDAITEQGYRWVFRANCPSSHYTDAPVEFFEQVLKPKTAALVYENTDFGMSSAKGLRLRFEILGIEIIHDEAYEKGGLDFTPMLAKIREKNPDLFYPVSYVMDAVKVSEDMKKLGLNIDCFFGGGAGYVMVEYVEALGKDTEGIFSTTLWVPSVNWPGGVGRNSTDFANEYLKRFGKDPHYIAAQAYSSMYVIQDALSRAEEISHEGIRKALAETDKTFTMGPIKFESWSDDIGHSYTQQNKAPTYVVQWQNEKLEVIWPPEVKTADYIFPTPKWGEK